MKREIIPAKDGHEKEFRTTWVIRSDVRDDPMWRDAYEYAATHKLYPDEMDALGPVLVRREGGEGGG